MSFLKKTDVEVQAANAFSEIISAKHEANKAIFNTDMASDVVAMESFGSLPSTGAQDLEVQGANANQMLADAGMEAVMNHAYGVNHLDDNGNPVDQYVSDAHDLAMEAGALAFMSAGAGKDSLVPGEVSAAMLGARNGGHFIAPADRGAVLALESFHDVKTDEFVGQSVHLATVTAASSPVSELFYPTDLLPAGVAGRSASLRTPYIYRNSPRTNDGSVYEIKKIPLLRAHRDHTILAAEILKCWPDGDNAANLEYLVDAAVVPNSPVTIDGITVNTRPLLFGKRFNMLGVSSNDLLLGSAVQSNVDTMSPNAGAGTVWVRVTVKQPNDAAGAAVPPVVRIVKVDIDGAVGALMSPPSTGGGQNDLVMNMTSTLLITNLTAAIGTTGTAGDTGVGTYLADGGNGWNLGLDYTITGNADHQTANMVFHANSIELGEASISGADGKEVYVEKASVEYKALLAATTVELIAHLPRTSRANLALRQVGTMLDNGEEETFFFEVRPGSPFTALRPGGNTATGVADVAMLKKGLSIRSHGSAITELLRHVDEVKAAFGTGTNIGGSATFGSRLGVKTQYASATIDAASDAVFTQTRDNLDNFKALIIDTISMMVTNLLIKSEYLTALKYLTGRSTGYEIIIATSARIERFLMRSGDERTFGQNMSFRIAVDEDERMDDKCIISVRRKGVTGPDPLSHGFRLSQNPVVYTYDNSSRTQDRVDEIHVNAGEHHATTLPICAELFLTNLDTFTKNRGGTLVATA